MSIERPYRVRAVVADGFTALSVVATLRAADDVSAAEAAFELLRAENPDHEFIVIESVDLHV